MASTLVQPVRAALRCSRASQARSALTSPFPSPVHPCARHLHKSLPWHAEKPSVALLASLRKARPVPLSLAREALERSNNDLDRAIDFLDTSTTASSKKAEKVSGRDTNEGVIAISLLGEKRVGMVHVGCETDFVARNDVFLRTARSIAGTTAFLDVPNADPEGPLPGVDPILDFPVSALLSAPLISMPPEGADHSPPMPSTEVTTVSQALLASLGQTGENLKLLRAVSFAAPFPSSPLIRYVPGAYTHGGSSSTEGKVGGIVVLSAESSDNAVPMASKIHGPGGDRLEADLLELARTVARQVVGFPTRSIRRTDGVAEEETLMDQPAMMFGKEEKVVDILKGWGEMKGVKVDVVGFRRWAVSDSTAGEAAQEGPSGGILTEDGA